MTAKTTLLIRHARSAAASNWGLFSSGLLFTVALLAGCTFNAQQPDALQQVKQRGKLIWGGDQEGGGPYVYPDPEHPETVRGFEVDLAAMLADELGVKAEFKQGNWDKLPLLLGGTIDVVLNGYELTGERQRDFLCSRPYYVYGLQLLVEKDSPIQSWADLQKAEERKPVRVGALTGSAAERYLRETKGLNVEVETYDGTTDAMQRVATKALDATLQDDPTAIFYADQYPTLRPVGDLVGPGFYVAMVKKTEPRLNAALDEAFDHIIADGRLEKLYDHWRLHGKRQVDALAEKHDATTTAAQQSPLEILQNNLGVLLASAGMTVLLSVTAMPLAIAIGILVAIGRMYGPWPVSKLLGLYVELLRGTPLMLQLYAIFFLLPRIGVPVPALVAAIAGLAINYSAYEAENYRARPASRSRARATLENHALSLGMSRALAIRRILLPQAFRIVIPPVTNDFIALFKDTSVCSVVTVVELTKRAARCWRAGTVRSSSGASHDHGAFCIC